MSAPTERARWNASVVAASSVVAWAVLHAFPGLGPLDAGDFVTAVATNGVPHATGFPVYLEVGRLSVWPALGSLAFRVALTSALASGVAAACFTWLGSGMARGARGAWPVAAAVVIGFAAVETLSLHARTAEVYALNLALIGGALVSFERLVASRARGAIDPRWLAALALALGLGLANHALFRLWAPLMLLWAVAVGRSGPTRAAWAGSFLVGALPLLAYGALVAAAQAEPIHNWGDPSTLGRWWAHVTARDIRTAFGGEMAISGATVTHARSLATAMFAGLGALSVLGVAGLAVGARRLPACAWMTCVAAEVGYAVAINPMGLRDAQNGQLLAVSLAAGGGALIAATVGRLPLRDALAAPVTLCAVFAAAAIAPGSALGRTGADWTADDLGALSLAFAEPDPVVVGGSDTGIAGLLYAWAAVDARPDAAVFGRHVLTDGRAASYALSRVPGPLVDDALLAQWSTEGPGPGAARERAVLSALGKRPIYWEVGGNGSGLPPGLAAVHVWPMARVVATEAVPDAASAACGAGARGYCGTAAPSWGGDAVAPLSRFGRDVWARGAGFSGRRAFRSRSFADAVVWFERAVELAPWNATWWTGLAVSLANLGDVEGAVRVQLHALSLNPLSERARENAILYAEAAGDAGLAARLRAGGLR